ncbi:hypothetical protein BGP_4205 [Beggiatoa sp. PS]|nr:hypothetical protein BGP_4205 [Beggiatoa sp. PS]
MPFLKPKKFFFCAICDAPNPKQHGFFDGRLGKPLFIQAGKMRVFITITAWNTFSF